MILQGLHAYRRSVGRTSLITSKAKALFLFIQSVFICIHSTCVPIEFILNEVSLYMLNCVKSCSKYSLRSLRSVRVINRPYLRSRDGGRSYRNIVGVKPSKPSSTSHGNNYFC